MKYYCIYKITNKVNGKTYIGQHRYSNEDDPMGRYYGSGVLIVKAVKKYGKENFTREVLYKRIINKDTINAMEKWAIEKYKPDYNIADGGSAESPSKVHSADRLWRAYTSWWIGAYNYDGYRKHIILKGTKRPESVIKKIKATKNSRAYNITEETRRKMSEAAHNRDNSNNHTNSGKKWYNNGLVNVLAFECPEGFKSGQMQDKVWYTNGKQSKQFKLGTAPQGWRRGRYCPWRYTN